MVIFDELKKQVALSYVMEVIKSKAISPNISLQVAKEEDIFVILQRPQWRSGKTLASHLGEVGGSNPIPHGGKMVVSYRWSAVYSTEP